MYVFSTMMLACPSLRIMEKLGFSLYLYIQLLELLTDQCNTERLHRENGTRKDVMLFYLSALKA